MQQVLRRRFWTILLALFAIGGLSVMAFAQGRETGLITGTVTDPSGAVVTNAKVTAKSVNTGAVRTTVANQQGGYTITGLQPGPYDVTFEAPGFSPQTTRVDVTVGSVNTADAKLALTSQQTTVEVVGAGGVEVNTETQELSNVVSGTSITTLPTLTRNPYDLVATAPNVSAGDIQNETVRGAGVNINGQRSASTDVLLDGGENVDEFTATVGQQTPLDSVQEFRVVTSDFTAEYGRASGGVVNVATKSGTNDFHGSVYEFNRLSALTSNTYANSVSPDTLTGTSFTPKPGYTRNQFGFSLGGPIVKNKLFFFNNTEFIRVRSNATFQALIPSTAAIATASAANPGVAAFFSQFGTLRPGAAVGAPVSCTDITSFSACGAAAATAGFPNLAAFGTAPLFNNVVYVAPSDSGGGFPQNNYNIVTRIDYNASDKTQIYGRYALNNEDDFAGSINNSPYAGFDTGQFIFNQNLLFSVSHVFTPNLVNQVRLTYNRLNLVQPLGTAPVGPTLYMNDTIGVQLNGKFVMFPGYSQTTPGNAIPFGGPQNIGQVADDLSWTRGKHQFKFGGQYVYTQDNRVFGAYEEAVEGLHHSSVNNEQAMDNFLAGIEGQFSVAVNPQGKFPCFRDPAANVLIPNPNCTLAGPLGQQLFSRSNRYHDFALYGQDSWRMTPRLTINLGLRWEYYGVQHNVDPSLDSNFYYGSTACPPTAPGCPGIAPVNALANGQVFVAPNSPVGGLWNPNYSNLGPRVGFAWDVFGNGTTSIRGGYGISYERNFGNVTFNVIQNPPNYGVVQVGTNSTPVPIFSSNLGPLAGPGTFLFPPPSLRHVDQNIDNAYSEFWSFTIEHQVLRNSVLSVGYSGSHGVHLYDISQFNRGLAGCMYIGGPAYPCTGLDRPNLQYGSDNQRGSNAFSRYNALIVSFRTNNMFNAGLSFNANYTYSHTIDNLSTTFSESNNQFNLGYLDPYNPAEDTGNADFDARHRVVFSGIWDLPFARNSGGIAKQVLGGWTLAPIFTARTGTPFTIWDCGNGFFVCARSIFNATPRSSVVANPDNQLLSCLATGAPASTCPTNTFTMLITPPGTQYADPILGTADFGICNSQPTTVFPCLYPGNMTRRNSFAGPNNWDFNLGFYKNFKLTERFNLQFRSEFYNLFNHHNFYIAGASAEADCLVAVACSATGAPANQYSPVPITGVKGGFGTSLDERRFIQFALKLIF